MRLLLLAAYLSVFSYFDRVYRSSLSHTMFEQRVISYLNADAMIALVRVNTSSNLFVMLASFELLYLNMFDHV